MRIFFLVSFISTLFFNFSFSQCGSNEIEIKINISTDSWGEETYWKLTNLAGTVVLQGGQGGVYEANTNYSDSICLLSNDCFLFEIYDTFGDGILTPFGYELFVNESLVSSGSNDIGSYSNSSICPDSCNILVGAMNDFKSHINGITTLNSNDLTLIRNIFFQFSECLTQSESVITLAKSIEEDYDNQIGALFTTPNTEYGFLKDPIAAPGFEVERAMIALQQGIFDYIFSPQIYSDFPQHLYNWKFNSCYNFPGNIAPPQDSTTTKSTLIRANFEDPDGMNPYFDINGDGTNHALRPTGLYLAPGSIATLTLPDSLVGKNYFIRVGSHEWDLTNRNSFRRLDRISKKFAIDSNTIKVFNPLGGAISILVPYGANEGIVEVSITNAVEAPFFSLKSFYESPDFNAELNKPGPWAVFETDNVMFTIPKHSIIPGQYDLTQVLIDWDSALQGVNSVIARQIVSDKHNMYMIADLDIRFDAYSIGYPMSNTPLNYTDVPGTAYFLNGPGPDDETNFHESGHALAISKFPGEEEALVNVPYIMALNYGLGVNLNEAINYSFVPNTYNIDNTATHRMISNTFGSNRDISNTTTDEVRYQHRGYGHYFEIVNLFGWCPLRNFWKQEFIDFENGINHGINDQNIDSRILRMCKAAKVDLRPIFHVYGLLPQNSNVLQDSLAQNGILPSSIVYNRLQDYLELIPENNSAFVNYALEVYPDLYTEGPISDPDYGVGWHYLKSLNYNEVQAQQRVDILTSIINLYFQNGEPTNTGNLDVCCILDTMIVNIVNDEVVVSGGVAPFNIAIDTLENKIIVTVLDFNGCESTNEFLYIGLTEENFENLTIYPNPATSEINIDFSGKSDQIKTIQLISIQGQVLKHYDKESLKIDVSSLSESVYILQIELENDVKISKRILIMR